MVERGKIIVIDGTDGVGKKTQVARLVGRLKNEGFKAQKISFPRYHTPTGRIISQCYLGKKQKPERGDIAWFGDADEIDPKLASLYYAADRYAAAPFILETVNSGTNAILDRYYFANMAHQGGKIRDPAERMAFYEFCRTLELELLKVPKQDIAILLDLPTEVAWELRKKRKVAPDLHESNLGHIKRSQEAYREVAESYWYDWKVVSCAPDGTINSLKTVDQIHEEIYSHVITNLFLKK